MIIGIRIKHLILGLLIVTSICAVAQDLPQGIAYQAVAVKEGPYSVAGQNPQAIYWSNKDIKVRFTILDQYPNPMDTYQEYHYVTTDDYGVFNLIIGQGTVISGDFETIPWELGTAHLQVEIDFDNDDNFKVTSFERFWSVPYAFVSKKDESTNIDSALQALNDKITYLKNRDQDTVIGNEGITYKTIDSLNQVLQSKIDALRANDLDTVLGNEIQTLAIKGDSLSISDGNTVKIDFPSNLDNDPVNEIQNISLSNDTINLSKGGGKIALKDINDYVKSNSVSKSSTNASSSYSQNSLCFEGTLIDLTSWANNLSISSLGPIGIIYDSGYVFAGNGTVNSGIYLLDLSKDTIFKISSTGGVTKCGDSIVYCCSSNCDAIKINNDLSFTTINFSGGPGLQKSGNGLPYGGRSIVNQSRDLIWVPYLWAGGMGDFKKYSFSNQIITTTNNPDKGGSSEAALIVCGDTIVLGNCLINSSNMSIIRSFSFLTGLSRQSYFLFNNKIYYFKQTRFREFNLKNYTDTELGSAYPGQFLGVNNDQLWIKLPPYPGTTATSYNLINLSLLASTSNVVSLNKNGLLNHRGYNINGSSPTRMTDLGKIIGSYYTNTINNRLHSNCYNGTFPSEGLGLFFSDK